MKRAFTILAATVLCIGTLAGCGRKSGGSSSDSASGSSKAESTGTKKPVSITVTTSYAGEDSNAVNYQEAVRAWEKKTGNTVLDSSASADETQKAKILASYETGSNPDVLLFFNGADANPLIENRRVLSIDEIRADYPDYASNMKDGMMGASPVDGKNYSVPVNGIWEGLFVNKEVLAACQAELPGPDTTWDEFLALCQTIRSAGYDPIAASLATIPHYWFDYAIFNNGSVESHATVPASLDDDRAKAFIGGLGDIKELYEKGFFSKNTLTGTDDETMLAFTQGKAAFLLDGSWTAGKIERACGADPDNGVAPDPALIQSFTVTYLPGKGERKTTDIIAGLTSGYYISRNAYENAEKRAALVDFVTFMTSDEMVSKFAGTAANALKNGAQIDESKLSSLGRDSLAFIKGATGTTGAVQDLIPNDARVPLFVPGMVDIVTGKTTAREAVQACLDLLGK